MLKALKHSQAISRASVDKSREMKWNAHARAYW